MKSKIKKYLSQFLIILALILMADYSVAAQSVTEKSKSLFSKAHSKKNYLNSFKNRDFSRLFKITPNQEVFGFIGDNYQRLQIKFITVNKDTAGINQYIIIGRTKAKGNINDFKGVLQFKNIVKLGKLHYGTDDMYKNEGIKGEYVITGNYILEEDHDQPHSGVFKGTFESDFYIDKNDVIRYDDIELGDSYTNNQFEGTWTSYKGNLTKQCNWGDYRIPHSGDLDIGAGDFSPADKYLKYGWQDIRDNMQNPKRSKEIQW